MTRKNLRSIFIFFLAVLLIVSSATLWAGGKKEKEEEAAAKPEAAAKYKESSMLKARVAKGELPPVDERLPEEPMVIEPFGKIGKYGGSLQVFAINPNAWNDLQPGVSNWGGMFRAPPYGKSLGPNIAKGFTWSSDLKSFTIHLRKGLKWSNGELYTADDIVFQFQDVYGNAELYPSVPSRWTPGGELIKTVKVDDYTCRLEFSIPNPQIEAQMYSYLAWQTHFYNPKHYLKKWHIKYNDKAGDVAKQEGFENWWQAFKQHEANFPQQNDVELPRMLPWVIKQKTSNMYLFERNPFYWKVDPAGNQLPYIDSIRTMIVDTEVFQLKAVGGEADLAWHPLSLDNYPMYKGNEKQGGYTVKLHPWPDGAQVSIGFNFNEKDPVLRKIYHTKKFRQALSLAIDREEINEAIYFGQAVPRQVAPLPGNSYFKKDWAEYFIQYDKDKANQFLDEIGLKRGKDGFRLRPDGKRLELTIEYWELKPTWTAMLELVKAYWEEVGVKVAIKSMERSLFGQRSQTSDHGLMVWERGRDDEIAAYSMPWIDFFHGGELSFFRDWQNAIDEKVDGSKYDMPGDEITFKDVKAYRDRILAWQATPMGSAEYTKLAEEIFDYFCTQLWCIGTVGLAPRPYIFKSRIQNIGEIEKDYSTGAHRYQDFAFQWYLE